MDNLTQDVSFLVVSKIGDQSHYALSALSLNDNFIHIV